MIKKIEKDDNNSKPLFSVFNNRIRRDEAQFKMSTSPKENVIYLKIPHFFLLNSVFFSRKSNSRSIIDVCSRAR